MSLSYQIIVFYKTRNPWEDNHRHYTKAERQGHTLEGIVRHCRNERNKNSKSQLKMKAELTRVSEISLRLC